MTRAVVAVAGVFLLAGVASLANAQTGQISYGTWNWVGTEAIFTPSQASAETCWMRSTFFTRNVTKQETNNSLEDQTGRIQPPTCVNPATGKVWTLDEVSPGYHYGLTNKWDSWANGALLPSYVPNWYDPELNYFQSMCYFEGPFDAPHCAYQCFDGGKTVEVVPQSPCIPYHQVQPGQKVTPEELCRCSTECKFAVQNQEWVPPNYWCQIAVAVTVGAASIAVGHFMPGGLDTVFLAADLVATGTTAATRGEHGGNWDLLAGALMDALCKEPQGYWVNTYSWDCNVTYVVNWNRVPGGGIPMIGTTADYSYYNGWNPPPDDDGTGAWQPAPGDDVVYF